MSEGLEQHRQAYAYCAYCPKVCRFACPVSAATHSETTSTWGKMTGAFLVTTGKAPLNDGAAQALHACTGCMRCRSFCAHENEVGFSLFSARSLAREAGSEPEAVRSTRDTFRHSQNPFGKNLAEEVERYPADGPVRFQLFAGCTALAKRPQLVEDALEVARGFSTPMAVCKAGARCCGYPLYAAGDLAGFREHARQVARALEPYPEIVALDPGCAYTFKVVYPRMGVALDTHVQTLTSVLDERREHGRRGRAILEQAAYQDACHLGRGLGEYDPPRRLLGLAVERVVEAQASRSEGGCSGGGGLLPRTMPETALEVARREAEAVAPGGETIVTACPTSSRMIERTGRKTADLVSVLRRWLDA
jgi:fumarate reductase (CoM/CoB) subunit B